MTETSDPRRVPAIDEKINRLKLENSNLEIGIGIQILLLSNEHDKKNSYS